MTQWFIDILPVLTGLAAIWGIVITIVLAVRWGVQKYRGRHRLYVYASVPLVKSFDHPGGAAQERRYFSIFVENKSPNPIEVLSWDIDRKNDGKPLVLEHTDLPATLPGYRHMVINDYFALARFKGMHIRRLYVVTGGGKKWPISKENLREFLRDINSLSPAQLKPPEAGVERTMSEEKVTTRAFCEDLIGFGNVSVEVVNTGECDVFIRDVVLRHRKSPKDRGFAFVTSDPRANRALAPGDRRIYKLPGESFEKPLVRVLQKFRAECPDDVWIVVRSNRRELARIDGAEVIRVIDEVLSRSSTS
ncbi:MAG: hypothetical protein V3T84_14615 [Phycisphaerales bacterium]